MAPPGSTPLRPIAALLAMRRLLRDREDTRQAFLVIEALRGNTTLRQFARFRDSESGRRMQAERPSLLAALSDRASLAAMPAGSLGRAYFDFVSEENLSADGLVEASKIRPTPPAVDDVTWFRERNREMHDLLHVTAGYGRDPLGEACILAFTFAQTGQKGMAVIAAIGAWRGAKRLRSLRVPRAIFEAYRQGRRADWLIGAEWEKLLPQPLATVRESFRVRAPSHYPQLRPLSIAAAAAEQARLAAA